MFLSNEDLCTLFLLLFFSSSGNAADCQKPAPEGNVVLTKEAVLKNNFPDGSHITVECALGHEVDHGSNIITCVDGKWSELNLTCKKKDCGRPKPAANISYEMPNGTLFGAHIKPVCDRGYFLEGSSYRQCLAFGWVGNSRCVLIECEEPPEIPNGVIARRPNKSYPEYGDVIEYSCDPGYILIGNQSIICHDDGEYSSLPPVCIDIKTTENYPETSETTTTSIRTSTSTTTPNSSFTPPNSSSTPPNSSSTPPNSSSTPPFLGILPPNSGGSDVVLFPVVGAVTGIGIGIVCLVSGVIAAVFYVVGRRKGSYDTGEALKMKEELLQKRTQNLV